MARRPKRINLEAISDSTHPQHKKHVLALVGDLLRKYPRGPECLFTQSDYINDWSGHAKLHNHGDTDGVSCGYSDLTLFRFCTSLSLDGSEWDFKYRIQDWYPDLGKSGITRRSRRLAHRVEAAYRRVKRAGRPGIYKVSYTDRVNYNGATHIYIHAENPEMAVMVANCSVGPAFPKYEVSCNFEEEGCPSTLMGKNAATVNNIEVKIRKNHQVIKEMKENIELLELRAAMVQTYSISAVGT